MHRTLEQLIEEMLEFGLDLDAAERVAPSLLPLFNDPRGFQEAFLERYPALAERMQLRLRQ